MSASRIVLLHEQIDLFAGVILAPPPPEPEPAAAPRSRARHKPQGVVYDLERFFDVINEVVFKNSLDKCVMRWSRNRWRVVLGLCDVKRRVITLNKCLDDARIPEVVVASIMHHEMLHLHFGIAEGPRGTRRFHTPQFRLAEKQFPGYNESERWIKENWPLRGRPASRPRHSEQSFLTYLALVYP